MVFLKKDSDEKELVMSELISRIPEILNTSSYFSQFNWRMLDRRNTFFIFQEMTNQWTLNIKKCA